MKLSLTVFVVLGLLGLMAASLAWDVARNRQVRAGGDARFQQVTAEAGASCRAFDVVAALLREMEAGQRRQS